MVEGAPLLREYTRKGIVGSNPIFSAISNDPPKSTLLTAALDAGSGLDGCRRCMSGHGIEASRLDDRAPESGRGGTFSRR